MAITKLTADLSNISKLDDQPNDIGGLSAAELKAEFDKAGNSIKEYINSVLLPELESAEGAAAIGIKEIEALGGASDIQAAIEGCVRLVQQVSVRYVADGSIDTAKLAALAVTAAKLAAKSVTTDKIDDKAVTAAKLADKAVTAGKLAEGAVGTANLAGGAVTAEKLADGAVVNSKLRDGCISEAKIADHAVSGEKLCACCVSADKILDGAVSSGKLSDGAVTARKIGYGDTLPENPFEGQLFLLRVQ